MKLIKKTLVLTLFVMTLSSNIVFALENLREFDFNKDLIIDRKDLDMLNNNYNKNSNNPSWDKQYDLNKDNTIDIYDVVKVAKKYGEKLVDIPTIIDPHLDFNFGDDGPLPNNPEALVLHHAEASNASVYDIHRWHKNDNGWAGIGYHFYIRKDGKIYKGREENWRGAHAPAYNGNSLGICAEGAYDREDMPQAQKDAIIKLGKYLVAKYGIHEVFKHGQVTSTDCPGKKYPFDEVKKAILDWHV